jgi:hypothetical protein
LDYSLTPTELFQPYTTAITRRNEGNHHARGTHQNQGDLPDHHSHAMRRAAANQVAAPNLTASCNWRSVPMSELNPRNANQVRAPKPCTINTPTSSSLSRARRATTADSDLSRRRSCNGTSRSERRTGESTKSSALSTPNNEAHAATSAARHVPPRYTRARPNATASPARHVRSPAAHQTMANESPAFPAFERATNQGMAQPARATAAPSRLFGRG